MKFADLQKLERGESIKQSAGKVGDLVPVQNSEIFLNYFKNIFKSVLSFEDFQMRALLKFRRRPVLIISFKKFNQIISEAHGT